MSAVEQGPGRWQMIQRELRHHPIVVSVGLAVLALVLIYHGVYWWAKMPELKRLPLAAQGEAMALLQAARDTTSPLPDKPRHGALKRKVRGPVFVKLHLGGKVPFSYQSASPVVIWDALHNAAKQLRSHAGVAALSPEDKLRSRFKVDIAQGRAPMVTQPEILFAISLVPGVDGLGVVVDGKTAYLDPDESLRRGLVTGYQPFKFVREFKAGLHITEADEYLARELGMWENKRYKKASKRYFRFRTEGFVEAPAVDGKRARPLPVYRGNTPPPKFNRQAVIDSCVEGGNYILRQLMTQADRVPTYLATRRTGPIRKRRKLYTHPVTPTWTVKRNNSYVVRNRRRMYRDRLLPGQFKYIYYPLTDNYDVAGYSLPRHAGTTYALALLYGKLKGRPGVSDAQIKKFGDGAKIAIQFLAKMVQRGRCKDESRDFVCVSRGPMTDLGSSALPLVAIMEYQRQTGDTQYEGLGRKLANFLLYMQKSDGEFCHRYDVRAQRKRCKTKMLYYSGEAALGLAMAYKMLKDPRYKKATRKALDYLTGENYHPLTMTFLFGEDHWTCIAAEEAFPHVKREHYAQFCYEFAAFQRRHQFYAREKAVFDYEGGYGITPFFPPHLTPAGSRSEAMVSAYHLSVHRKETQPVIGAQVVRAFKYIVRHQVRLDNSYLLARPRFSIGAIRKSPIKYEVRIDYVQHTIAAMVRALDLVPK